MTDDSRTEGEDHGCRDPDEKGIVAIILGEERIEKHSGLCWAKQAASLRSRVKDLERSSNVKQHLCPGLPRGVSVIDIFGTWELRDERIGCAHIIDHCPMCGKDLKVPA